MPYSRVYLTTSLPYINAKPHLGHALEFVLSDVFARLYQMEGLDVFFSTGTDEHGIRIQRLAKEAGLDPKDFSDRNSKYFEELAVTLKMSTDAFIRTSKHPTHKQAVQRVWKEIKDAGFLYKKSYEGLYCIGCEEFKTEKDLVDGLCPDHKIAPEVVKEENWFFALSKFSSEIKKKVEEKEIHIYPEERRNEILKVLERGLEDISISRSKDKLSWGIPVPGDETQVMYVWFDALTNYISVLGFGSSDESLYEKYWKSKESRIVHVIGKGILRQHAGIWVGMLMALGLRLPTDIFVHGYVTVNGQKMSKSLGNSIDPMEIIERYGVDAFRYYCVSQVPTLADGDFSMQHFHEVYEAGLKNGLGNMVNRVTNIVEKKFGGSIEKQAETETDLFVRLSDLKATLSTTPDLRAAFEGILKKIAAADTFIHENALWEDAENKKDKIYTVIFFLRQLSYVLEAFMPDTAKKIALSLGLKKIPTLDQLAQRTDFVGVTKPAEPIFPSVERLA